MVKSGAPISAITTKKTTPQPIGTEGMAAMPTQLAPITAITAARAAAISRGVALSA
jgi:hypothetical protein